MTTDDLRALLRECWELITEYCDDAGHAYPEATHDRLDTMLTLMDSCVICEKEPVAWRWKHIKDDRWFYGKLPLHLQPRPGVKLPNHLVEVLYQEKLPSYSVKVMPVWPDEKMLRAAHDGTGDDDAISQEM